MDELVKAIAEGFDNFRIDGQKVSHITGATAAQIALRAIDAAGWQCVPKEPTEAMKSAWRRSRSTEFNAMIMNKGIDDIPDTWDHFKAALAAAPKLELENG